METYNTPNSKLEMAQRKVKRIKYQSLAFGYFFYFD